MPAVTIADAVRVSDSADTKAVLQADSTTQYFLPPRMTTAQKSAIVSPAEGAVVFDTDNNQLEEYTGATWQAAGGGAVGGAPFIDSTAIIKGSADATKLLRIEVDGFTTATTRVLTPPNYDGTIATLAGTETLTNKTLDADGTGNVITNIGSSEVKAELITGLTADAAPDGAADYVMTYDNSATTLKKVLLSNLPTSGGGNSFAILADEKAANTNGGGASATTWNARDLNTEIVDADAIVSISLNQFTPISGTYRIVVHAGAFKTGSHRLRLYNVTGAASVKEGQNARSGSADDNATNALFDHVFTANGTDAYRIDHYTVVASATNGLGVAMNVGGASERYMMIYLEKTA